MIVVEAGKSDDQFLVKKPGMIREEGSIQGLTGVFAYDGKEGWSIQPFQGRRPIFVGDDFTDEAGMEAARQFGGEGLRVAEVFGGQPAAVRAWLKRGLDLLSSRNLPSAVSAGLAP